MTKQMRKRRQSISIKRNLKKQKKLRPNRSIRKLNWLRLRKSPNIRVKRSIIRNPLIKSTTRSMPRKPRSTLREMRLWMNEKDR